MLLFLFKTCTVCVLIFPQEEILSPSSASEEEGDRKGVEKKKKKKKKLTFSEILKKVSFKKEEPRPQRPDSLAFKDAAGFPEPAEPAVSPCKFQTKVIFKLSKTRP